MGRKAYLAISGSIFGIVALLHLARALYHLPVQLGTVAIPVWPSWAAVVVAGVLCVWAFRLLRE
jgi:hypothetical protein